MLGWSNATSQTSRTLYNICKCFVSVLGSSNATNKTPRTLYNIRNCFVSVLGSSNATNQTSRTLYNIYKCFVSVLGSSNATNQTSRTSYNISEGFVSFWACQMTQMRHHTLSTTFPRALSVSGIIKCHKSDITHFLQHIQGFCQLSGLVK